jgi:hypothetical protein
MLNDHILSPKRPLMEGIASAIAVVGIIASVVIFASGSADSWLYYSIVFVTMLLIALRVYRDEVRENSKLQAEETFVIGDPPLLMPKDIGMKRPLAGGTSAPRRS